MEKKRKSKKSGKEKLPNSRKALRPDPFPELTRGGDPALRHLAWLISNKDIRQLEQRTGIRQDRLAKDVKPATYLLPVIFQFAAARGTREIAPELHDNYRVPRAYSAALKRNSKLRFRYVTGQIPLGAEVFRGGKRAVGGLRKAVTDLRALGVSRVCLGAPGLPSRDRQLIDIGMPHGRKYKNQDLTGEGVIVGIIDDGCALAHRDFLKRPLPGASAESKILVLWDQAGTGKTAAGWVQPAGFGGLELDQGAINAALNLPQHKNGNLICEDKVHDYLGYRIREVRSHGTHVMDIAAGTGQSLTGVPGIAPGADIIFVQLPLGAIEGGATMLWQHVREGAFYIFERAAQLGKAAVVNISYGGYDGPHDGTSQLEQALDELLLEPDRAIVLAAGNGFEARCHAQKTVPRNAAASLRWIVKPFDSTDNVLDAWYQDNSKLLVQLHAPGPTPLPLPPIALNQSAVITIGGNRIGRIEHLPGGTGNGANRIVITLNPTQADSVSGLSAPAPFGVWTVDLIHDTGPAAKVDAWIWRDDAGRGANARRRQSRFHPDEARPETTISGWATGYRTISVGAYNTATQEICRYSACGPTRPISGKRRRKKPEVYAPAEEDVRARGVLSASARSAMPTRINGTSAAAPHVAGLIALMFEYARKYAVNHPVALTADQITKQLKASSSDPNKIKFDRHQAVDAHVKVKQKDVKTELLHTGNADFTAVMQKLGL